MVMLVAGLAVATPGSLRAQGGDGYLFKEPRVTLKFESGYGWQRASGDIFDFVISDYTVGRRDFDSPYLGGEIAVRANEQLDIAFGVGYQSSSTQSEYRDYVGTDDLPIVQTTNLQQVPFTASVKFYPFPRGTRVGRFAWIPRRVVPFVGAGLGVVRYQFVQDGEFIDFTTFDIYDATVRSESSAFLMRASGGVNVSLGKQFVFSAEGRYNWADDEPIPGDFRDFNRIDLDGLQLIAGIAVRF